MPTISNRRIVSMNDTDLTLADPAEDVRGRTIVDVNGDDIGDVEDLMLDRDESKVRFLQVGAGGFLGIGEKKFLIPVDAITRIDDGHIFIDRAREHVIGGPEYDPTLVRDDTGDLWANAYSYYGYGPFWAPGYVSPAYPYFGTASPGRPDAPVNNADTVVGAGGMNTLSDAALGEQNPDVGRRDQRDTHD
jgi:sporulation protein YlmC with PRC-barrel domain